MDDKEGDTGREQGGREGRGKRMCGDRDEPLPVPERFREARILDTPDKLEQYLAGPMQRFKGNFKVDDQFDHFELFGMIPIRDQDRDFFIRRVREIEHEQRAMTTAALVHVCGDFKSDE